MCQRHLVLALPGSLHLLARLGIWTVGLMRVAMLAGNGVEKACFERECLVGLSEMLSSGLWSFECMSIEQVLFTLVVCIGSFES